MKQVLVIGSTVVDIIIKLDRLPRTAEDVHVLSQEARLGGCAYNVSDMIRHFGVPCALFSPIGTGIYGDFIRSEFQKKGLSTPLPTPEMANGCCYCFVEESGERTFICNHGAEYLIYDEWLREVDLRALEAIYICGLEIEEKTGGDIVRFLERARGVPVYFAPGPRLGVIPPALMNRIFALSPIVHLNAGEIRQFTGESGLEQAARSLFSRTGNTVIVTDGGNGAYSFDGSLVHAAAFPVAQVADTIGAGDAHIGACIACLAQGRPLEQALRAANRAAAAVVAHKGATLSKEEFSRLFK